MASCHECNSQLGENDLFCPFCGAKREAVPEPPADVPEVNSNATTEPSMTDIPIPAILADFDSTASNAIPEPTSEYVMDELELPVFEDEEETAEEPVPQIASESESEPEEDRKPSEAPDLFDARPTYDDAGIGRPLEELQEPEQPKSMYDSVRIMEPKA